jgi:hypothetical protein
MEALVPTNFCNLTKQTTGETRPASVASLKCHTGPHILSRICVPSGGIHHQNLPSRVPPILILVSYYVSSSLWTTKYNPCSFAYFQ